MLEELRARQGRLVSGAELAERLAVSRTAIWKQVCALRAAGYDIASHPRHGYSLTGLPDKLLPAEIRNGLPTRFMGCQVHCFQSVSSTQDVARALASQGAPEGTVVVAETQSAGKGRRGRQWLSPAGGGLWLSVLLRPAMLPAEVPRLTLAAGVAAARAITETTGLSIGLKWPNDLLVGERKTGGILAEMVGEPDGIDFVVLGIGINVSIQPDRFPPELRQAATSLQCHVGADISRVQLCKNLLVALEDVYIKVMTGGFGEVLADWRRVSVTLGRRVVLALPDTTVEGQAIDVTPDGGLAVLLAGGERRTFLAGEVSLCPADK